LIDSASEDRQDLAEAQVKSQISPSDAVIGVSVSGRTPYTVAGIRAASGLGAFTAALTSSRISPLSQAADLTIEVQTGPEVVAGSTRLKAGTAQKLVLNMISTATFVAMGHVYGGWMVDVEAGNAKQRDRALHIVTQLTEAPEPIVKRSLREAGGSAKVAVLMLKKGVSATEARARLEARNGDLGASLEWP
jgi:N-acetylmuramic acid 6-phosphate etherase